MKNKAAVEKEQEKIQKENEEIKAKLKKEATKRPEVVEMEIMQNNP